MGCFGSICDRGVAACMDARATVNPKSRLINKRPDASIPSRDAEGDHASLTSVRWKPYVIQTLLTIARVNAASCCVYGYQTKRNRDSFFHHPQSIELRYPKISAHNNTRSFEILRIGCTVISVSL